MSAEPRVRLVLTGRSGLLVAIAGGALLGIVGIWLVLTVLPGLLSSPERPTGTASAPPAAASTQEARRINATLFFVAPGGTELTPIGREVLYGATPAEQARRIAEAQVQPPPSGLLSAIPEGTEVRAVYLTPRGEAYVDVTGQMISGHAGGSLNEALAVYALVNAMIVNLPDVSAVQILVDGHEVDSLVGHLDLRHPLRRSTEWVQKGQ